MNSRKDHFTVPLQSCRTTVSCRKTETHRRTTSRCGWLMMWPPLTSRPALHRGWDRKTTAPRFSLMLADSRTRGRKRANCPDVLHPLGHVQIFGALLDLGERTRPRSLSIRYSTREIGKIPTQFFAHAIPPAQKAVYADNVVGPRVQLGLPPTASSSRSSSVCPSE